VVVRHVTVLTAGWGKADSIPQQRAQGVVCWTMSDTVRQCQQACATQGQDGGWSSCVQGMGQPWLVTTCARTTLGGVPAARQLLAAPHDLCIISQSLSAASQQGQCADHVDTPVTLQSQQSPGIQLQPSESLPTAQQQWTQLSAQVGPT
jgi:hypothetical protein